MIVVDTNLIGYLLVNGEHSESAEKVLLKDPGWAAPLLWRSEFRNTLVKCVRGGLVALNDAYRIMADAESLMSEGEYAVASGDVLSLAASAACSAYDAEFVVLARGLGVPPGHDGQAYSREFPGHGRRARSLYRSLKSPPDYSNRRASIGFA